MFLIQTTTVAIYGKGHMDWASDVNEHVYEHMQRL